MVKLVWKREDKYDTTWSGYANDVKLFEIITLADGIMLSYVLSSTLPGIESVEGRERNKLMIISHDLLDNWFERIGLKAVLE